MGKKLLWLLAGALVVLIIIKSPETSATNIKSVFEAVGIFFGTLIS